MGAQPKLQTQLLGSGRWGWGGATLQGERSPAMLIDDDSLFRRALQTLALESLTVGVSLGNRELWLSVESLHFSSLFDVAAC